MKANEDIICDCPDSFICIRVIHSTREGPNNTYIEIVVVVFKGIDRFLSFPCKMRGLVCVIVGESNIKNLAMYRESPTAS